MPPRCKRCKEPEALDRPLLGCGRCSRYYHPACHRPHPREPTTNWVCKRCLAGLKGQGKRRRFYHDNLLLSSRAASPSSASSGSDNSHLPRMAPSETISTAVTDTASPFKEQRGDAAANIIFNCSFSGCSAKIDGNRQVLCEAHLQVISNNNKEEDDVQKNGIRSAPPPAPSPAPSPAGTPVIPRRPTFASTSHPRKLLPATDKDRIVRRKSAINPLQFVSQQPTPKHSTAPSRGGSTMSPQSPRALAPRPSVRSPPPSPGSFGDEEPAKKRQKLSPSPGYFPTAPVNGTLPSRQSTSEWVSRKASLEAGSPRSSRRASKHSPQMPGRTREKETKSASRATIKLVRSVPVTFSKLRFLDPKEPLPGLPSEQSTSGVNGSTAGPAQRPSSECSELSFATAESMEWPNQSRRLSGLSNGQGQKAPPDRVREGAQNGYGPFQANGTTTSKPRPPKMHFPIRPAQITTTQPLKLPKPKEVDISRFDSLIYSQPGASTPPSDVDLAPNKAPSPPKAADTTEATPKDEPLYLDVDPRIHWPQLHSPAWHAAKQREIQARGKKKANFGRAAQSLRKQQLAEKQGESFEENLPEKILENPAWVRALRRLRGLPVGPPPDDSEGSSNGSVSGNCGNGVEVPGQQQRRGRKSSAVTGKRVGKSGVVVVTGLNEYQMEGLG